MSEQNQHMDIAHYLEEMNVYALFLEDTSYEYEIIDPTDTMPMPALAIELEEGEDDNPAILLYYMFVASDEEEDDDEDDDIFGGTDYLQVVAQIPVDLPEDESLLDVFLFLSAVNQNMPLGNVFISSDKHIAFRYVYAMDKEVGLTRSVFLETLYMIHFIVGQTSESLSQLISGELDLETLVSALAEEDE